MRCTLEEIAAATNLRIEDAAFALNECGLLMRRIQNADSENGSVEVDSRDIILITRALVDRVAEERNLKRMYMDPNGVML